MSEPSQPVQDATLPSQGPSDGPGDWIVRPSSEIVLDTTERQRRYTVRVAAAIERARLNSHWPPARTVANAIRAMGPDVHHGLYDDIRVDVRTGLPSYRDFTRLHTDAEMSARVLAELGDVDALERRARRRPGGIHGKQLLKQRYHSTLRERLPEGMPPSSMHVELRRVEPDHRRAHFHVVLDKIDASGVFVRFSIDLSQASSFWQRAMLELDEDAARETKALRSTIFRLTSLDAEFTFARLSSLDGIEVERVFKGTIGPFFMHGTNQPTALAALWSDASDAPAGEPEPIVASFGLDMAAVDVARDGDNDPLAQLLTDRLSDEGREGYEAARARYGYRVFKDRKFVVSPRPAIDTVQAMCAADDAKNVIYELR